MLFLRSLSERMREARAKSAQVSTPVAFCKRCPMDEGKSEWVYYGKEGKAYCDPSCAIDKGDEIEMAFNQVTKETRWYQ